MSTPEITIHRVTNITVKSKTIKHFYTTAEVNQDFGTVTLQVNTEAGEILEITMFVDNRDTFTINLDGIERGLHFI